MIYGFFFVLGMGYLMTAGGAFDWPPELLFVLVATMGFLVGSIAWWRRRHAGAGLPAVSNPVQRRLALRQGAAFVGLLVSLVAASVEWDFVFEHQGHLMAALLWSVGVAASILLAYGNRRATVVVALRAYLALLVIGAIAERKAAGLIFAAIAGAVYLLLEKLWKPPAPLIQHFEALSRESQADPSNSRAELRRH